MSPEQTASRILRLTQIALADDRYRFEIALENKGKPRAR